MNAWQFLEKIRNRSVAEKRLFAFFIAMGITAVIGISWVTVTLGGGGSEKKEAVAQDPASPFAAMGAQFRAIKKEFTDMKEETAPVVNELGVITNEFNEVLKNGTSTTTTLKYLKFTDDPSEEIIIEAEVENETGTSTGENSEIE